MIDIASAKNALDFIISDCLKVFGYTKSATLTYMKHFPQAEGYVLFGIRKDARNFFAATCSVGLRFPAFEKMLDDSWGSDIQINVPIHLLNHEISGFSEWKFSDKEELLAQKDDICQALSNVAIPFLDVHTTLQKLRLQLSSNSPKDWYVLVPEKRVVLLAAAQNALGDDVSALNTLNNALMALDGAPPKKRRAIESLIAKLQEDSRNM